MGPGGTRGRVIRIDLAYDGSDFSGYARQPGLRTVQEELESVLDRILGSDFETAVAGRTDAGVHALGQVVSVRTSSERLCEKLQKSLVKMLPADMAVSSVADVQAGFHARRSATSRRYRYRLNISDVVDPTRRHNTWWTGPLSIEVLSSAADALVGTHDFRTFCKSPAPGESTVRDVREARWFLPADPRADDEAWFEIEANSFCRQMVRRIVGRCVAAARGRCEVALPGEIQTLGCAPAPPQGLYLLAVKY